MQLSSVWSTFSILASLHPDDFSAVTGAQRHICTQMLCCTFKANLFGTVQQVQSQLHKVHNYSCTTFHNKPQGLAWLYIPAQYTWSISACVEDAITYIHAASCAEHLLRTLSFRQQLLGDQILADALCKFVRCCLPMH